MAGLFRGLSTTGAGSACSFFGLREGTTVRVKWSGKLYDSLGMRDMACRWEPNVVAIPVFFVNLNVRRRT